MYVQRFTSIPSLNLTPGHYPFPKNLVNTALCSRIISVTRAGAGRAASNMNR